MRVRIAKKPIATATFCLCGFRKDFLSTKNFEYSIKNNVTLEECEMSYVSAVQNLFFHRTDWVNLLVLSQGTNTEKVLLSMYMCVVEGFQSYDPKSIDLEQDTFNFEDVLLNKTNFLVTTSINKRWDKHIEFMLSQNTINYAQKEWKLLVDLKQ